MPEFVPVPGDRQQKGLHQAFKTVALVPFGKGYGAVFGEDIVELVHGGYSLSDSVLALSSVKF